MATHNLLSRLRAHADERGSRPAFTYLSDGETERVVLTYEELDRRARRVATRIVAAGGRGKRALLLYAPDLEYIVGFLGCVYAGTIAVPAYPPDPSRLERTLPRLRAIVEDASADLILTTTQINALATMLFDQAPELAERHWLVTDDGEGDPESWSPPNLTPESTAFIQYTSGSTGNPKGVVLSHDNLLTNLRLIMDAFGAHQDSVGFSWLPPYHDMGLIGGILGPLYLGAHSALISPIAFLQRPIRWLEGVSRFRATISGGPNFAYELCIRRVQSHDFEKLDLASWDLAFCGAEPVRPETLSRFYETFAQCGFERRSFFPCYGLAESTLIVSGGKKSEEPIERTFDVERLEHGEALPSTAKESRALIGCGTTLADQNIRIVDPSTRTELPERTVGEIWVSGRSISNQYWEKPDLTAQKLRAELPTDPGHHYLRTGDLGFLDHGELFVTGRLKDLIIIRGRNLYPQDIEKTVEESHPALRRGCCAAFSMELTSGNEGVVVAVELERRYHQRRKTKSNSPPAGERRSGDRRSESPANLQSLGADDPQPVDRNAVCSHIRDVVAREHAVRPDVVLLVKAGALPKTSSGKIQRSETRKLVRNDALDVLERSAPSTDQAPADVTDTPPLSSAVLRTVKRDSRADHVVDYLRSLVARGLGVTPDEVDVDAPLASFGLDSLAAVEIGHELERNLGAVLPASSFLRESTITKLATDISKRIKSAPPPPSIRHDVTSSTTFELSEGQKALWFLQQLEPTSAAYNVACALQFGAGIDEGDVERSLRRIVQRHEVLRTSFFVDETGSPLQRVNEDVELHVERVDATRWSHEHLLEEVSSAAHEAFSLAEDVLLRARWYRREQGGVLLLATHHIAVDFWAMALLLDELRSSITSLQEEGGVSLAELPPPVRYRDYVRWQEKHLAAEGEQHWEYWRQRLAGELPRLELPTDHRRPPRLSHRGAQRRFTIPRQLAIRLRAFSKDRSATLFNVLLAAYQLLLSRCTGATDVLVGTPTAGRTRARFSQLVGLLMNPVVIRTDLGDNPSFSGLLERVRDNVLDALDHHEFPFAELVNRLRPDRDPARMPLIDTLFALEQASTADPLTGRLALGVPGAHGDWGSVRVESFPHETRSSQFDLSLFIVEGEEHLSGWFGYCTDLFDPDAIDRLAHDFLRVLEVVIEQPDESIGTLPLASRDLVEQVRSWNSKTARSLPEEVCVERWIADRVTERPNAAAVSDVEGTILTYQELDERVTRLSDALRNEGVKRGELVAICLERSVSLVVAHLAVMRAGAAFVPLDPSFPAERCTYMLEDSGARFLIVGDQTGEFAGVEDVTVIDVDEASAREAAIFSHRRSAPSGDDLAYVIYTSGSTGRPKGVAVSHRNLANLILGMAEVPGFDGDDVLAAVTTTAFDISYLELFLPLAMGGQLVVVGPEEARDGRKLAHIIREHGVTTMQATPATWQLMTEAGELPTTLRVLCGGEALSESLADELVGSNRRVYNMYGPTETTIWSTCELISGDRPKVLVGHPTSNTSVYVLDQHAQIVPPGVIGEVFLGGEGVAHGYWRRASLTAERFVPDPFAEKAGARLYRTGDLGRFRNDGRLEHLGRRDAQVKIRGYRVELGEVEAVLGSHLAIREAAVVLRDVAGGSRDLVGFVTPGPHESVGPGELREFAKGLLPRYMIPARIEIVEEMPRTPNGKLDRKALLAGLSTTPDEKVVRPRNATERALCGIFQEVLETKSVGITQDFFALGGHSLLATRVVTRIGQRLEVSLPVRALFEAPTVEALAQRVHAAQRAGGAKREGALFKPIRRARRKKLRKVPAGAERTDDERES